MLILTILVFITATVLATPGLPEIQRRCCYEKCYKRMVYADSHDMGNAKQDCSSYQRTTVTPCATTTTISNLCTVTADLPVVTLLNAQALKQQDSKNTPNYCTSSQTGSNPQPSYANGYCDGKEFAAACSCLGVPKIYTIASRSTATTTVCSSTTTYTPTPTCYEYIAKDGHIFAMYPDTLISQDPQVIEETAAFSITNCITRLDSDGEFPGFTPVLGYGWSPFPSQLLQNYYINNCYLGTNNTVDAAYRISRKGSWSAYRDVLCDGTTVTTTFQPLSATTTTTLSTITGSATSSTIVVSCSDLTNANGGQVALYNNWPAAPQKHYQATAHKYETLAYAVGNSTSWSGFSYFEPWEDLRVPQTYVYTNAIEDKGIAVLGVDTGYVGLQCNYTASTFTISASTTSVTSTSTASIATTT